MPRNRTALQVWGDGETGDFKCLTVVKLKPRPFRKPGLFFESNKLPRVRDTRVVDINTRLEGKELLAEINRHRCDLKSEGFSPSWKQNGSAPANDLAVGVMARHHDRAEGIYK